MKKTWITLAVACLFSGTTLAGGMMGKGGGMGGAMGQGGGMMGEGGGMGGGMMDKGGAPHDAGKDHAGMGAAQSMEQMRKTQQDRFRMMDGDQDGYITREEAQHHQRLTENWEKADTDADGRLNASEFSAFEEIIPPGRGANQ